MSARERDSSDEIQQLRNELQLVIEERQASMMHDIMGIMVELTRNNAPSESSSAEGSAVVRASLRGAEPTSVRATLRKALLKGVANKKLNPLLRHDNFLLLVLLLLEAEREDIQQQQERRFFVRMASRSVGVTGRGGATVPVEVGPARGQPDQGGLENGGHTPAVSWEQDMISICLYLDLLSNTPLSQN